VKKGRLPQPGKQSNEKHASQKTRRDAAGDRQRGESRGLDKL
jgi:hypothetical protein